MKPLILLLCSLVAAFLLHGCSGSQYEDLPEDNYIPTNDPVAIPSEVEVSLQSEDFGYASTSNATLVVKEIDSYEGSVTQAYYLEGFLGRELPDTSIATSSSTRILMDPDSLRIYVLYPNKNFTVLGWNGIQRASTLDAEVFGADYGVTFLRIDYSITHEQLNFKGISGNYTPCSQDGWGRSAEITFDGLYNESIHGYEGSFTWSEGPGEQGGCIITCTGTMELLLDE